MLSYCTNIHPAESWAETREALFTCVPRIRQELAAMDSPLKDLPLGIGLRLSARAAAELLETPHAVETLKSWLEDQGARVETLNGFPYGNFHGQRVKERVSSRTGLRRNVLNTPATCSAFWHSLETNRLTG